MSPSLPLQPGRLDRRVTIQIVTDDADAAGVPVDSLETLATVWMGREPLSGAEKWQSNQEAATFDAKWLMAYRADMDPDLLDVPKSRRLVYQGRGMDIVSAEHLGMKDAIALMTRASTQVSA